MTSNSTRDFRSLSVPEMEQIVADFEKRLNESQRKNPPTKEFVKNSLHRRGLGRCPVRNKRLSFDIILKYGQDLAGLFEAYPDDAIPVIPYDITIGYQPPSKEPKVNPIEALTRDAHWVDEWGTQWGHAFGGVGATPTDYPLKDWATLDEYIATGIPNPREPGRYDNAAELIRLHGDSKYCFGIIHLALFERLHSIRGMEALFTDFFLQENELRKLMDALREYLLELIRMWAEIGADGVFMTDDWGSQSGLMISPELWRDFFKQYYTDVCEETHKHGMDVLFHSCGNVHDIVGDLIDAGVDVLDPIQPGAMNIERLAAEYGGKIAFSGAVDIQQLLQCASPPEIKSKIHRIIDTIGKPFGGGLLIGPANVLTPDTPFENLVALFEATHE
jgi:uroporphyrinogen decarboxylase